MKYRIKHYIIDAESPQEAVEIEKDLEKSEKLDLQYLIDDEYEAINGYKKMIAQTKNPALLSLLSHILIEETEHVEELRNAQEGIYEVEE